MKYIKSLMKKLIPERYHALVRYIGATVLYFGFGFECPCCGGHLRKFFVYKFLHSHLSLGIEPWISSLCPRCFSAERHRLLWLYLKDRTNFFKDNLKVLHVSPMPLHQRRLEALPNLDYISADISSPLTMLNIDITDIPLPDDQFDYIICYHVFEHILDDEKAMRELFRVLKPGGKAMLEAAVDLNRDKTFEDPKVVSPEERQRVFGQEDHVRIYGSDYKDRLEKAGFVVKVDNYVQQLEDSVVRKYSLRRSDKIHICSKPPIRT